MSFKRVLFLAVFFRGFRGHNIRHYQFGTVPGMPDQNLPGMSLSKKKMLSGAGMLAANARGG
jgi:hypothetical protein